jgi:hypothetical protein
VAAQCDCRFAPLRVEGVSVNHVEIGEYISNLLQIRDLRMLDISMDLLFLVRPAEGVQNLSSNMEFVVWPAGHFKTVK